MPTMIFYVLILLGLLVVFFALGVMLLRWGLFWAKAHKPTVRRVMLALALIALAQTVVGLVLLLCSSTENPLVMMGVLLGALANSVLIPCPIISKVIRIRFARSFLAYLPLLLLFVVGTPLSRFVIRPYVMETYHTTSSSMAPTILGFHRQGICQECGSPGFCTVIPGIPRQPRMPMMICEDHFHVTRSRDCGDRILKPDRIIVAKFLKPRRWDIIVFRNPANPRGIYCKRLVGLPGEEIEIRDGSVWANGSKLIPPDAIGRIRYVSEIPASPSEIWGASGRPAKLAADEYFVLGDFSENAMDSRLWSRGAPGHHPYGVPESYVLGVATHIIWPAHRWRTLR